MAIANRKGACILMVVAATAGVFNLEGEARAAQVSLNNASFESPALGDGAFSDVVLTGATALPSWGTVIAGGNGAAGVQNWGAAEFTNATGQGVPPGGDGPQGLYVNNYTNGLTSSAFQNVGALQPNTTYTLTVAIGQRLDRVNDPGTIALVNVPVADNSSNAGTVLSSTTGISAVAGSFQDFTTTFTTGSVVSGNLMINLSETDLGGLQAAFDNVRLDATSTAVPEPASAGLLAVSAVGLLARRRRGVRRI